MTSRTAAAQLAPRPRRLALTGLAAGAALILSACQITSPVTTDMDYPPADGVSVDAGSIAVRDLLVVSEGNGSAGVVSGLVVNNASEAAEVTLSITGADGQSVALTPAVSVEPGQAVRLDGGGTGGSGEAVQVPEVSTGPGSNLPIVVQTSLGDAESGLAPVLLPEGPYVNLAPSDTAS